MDGSLGGLSTGSQESDMTERSGTGAPGGTVKPLLISEQIVHEWSWSMESHSQDEYSGIWIIIVFTSLIPTWYSQS